MSPDRRGACVVHVAGAARRSRPGHHRHHSRCRHGSERRARRQRLGHPARSEHQLYAHADHRRRRQLHRDLAPARHLRRDRPLGRVRRGEADGDRAGGGGDGGAAAAARGGHPCPRVRRGHPAGGERHLIGGVECGVKDEFGRSAGGLVNVITKSGTNETKGSLHYFGKFDQISGSPQHTSPTGLVTKFEPDFSQNQFGFTLGGPIKRDRAFFFFAYDQQIYHDVKQKTRPSSPQLDSLKTFLTARYPVLASDFGPISRTNDARAALAKFDFRLSDRHNLSLKYNYTWSEQKNGTFDVDTWGASANGLEKDRSHAVNGSLVSFLSSRTSNEFRFQYSREDRPRPYSGPTNPRGDTTGVSSIFGAAVPFHDTDVDPLNSFRFGLPFFLPIRDDHDTRIQLLDNVSIARGNHLFKFGGEWNRTATTQVFVGFAGGRMAFTSVHGFENFVNQGSHYIECSNGQSGVYPGFTCPVGTTISGPVILYLQQSGVGTKTVDQAGR